MIEEIAILKNVADTAKLLYNANSISREKAKLEIMPYVNAFNKKSAEIAKKYNQRPKLLSFAKFMR